MNTGRSSKNIKSNLILGFCGERSNAPAGASVRETRFPVAALVPRLPPATVFCASGALSFAHQSTKSVGEKALESKECESKEA
jgi:hypothetical protein